MRKTFERMHASMAFGSVPLDSHCAMSDCRGLDHRPMPRYALGLVTMAKSDLDLVLVDLPDPQGCPGPRIRDLRLPPGAVITLIIRDNSVLIP